MGVCCARTVRADDPRGRPARTVRADGPRVRSAKLFTLRASRRGPGPGSWAKGPGPLGQGARARGPRGPGPWAKGPRPLGQGARAPGPRGPGPWAKGPGPCAKGTGPLGQGAWVRWTPSDVGGRAVGLTWHFPTKTSKLAQAFIKRLLGVTSKRERQHHFFLNLKSVRFFNDFPCPGTAQGRHRFTSP